MRGSKDTEGKSALVSGFQEKERRTNVNTEMGIDIREG